MSIHSHNRLPIYVQIKAYIKKKLDDGHWTPDTAIPTERELAEQFQVTRMTIRQAVTELVHEGLLIRKRGKGTYVRQKKISQNLNIVSGFSEEMHQLGFKPSSTLLEQDRLPASKHVAQKLDMQENQEVISLYRLRLADGLPMALEHTFLRYDLYYPILDGDLEQESIYDLLEQRCQTSLRRARKSVEAAIADQTNASQLQVDIGAPLLRIEQVSFTTDGHPVEYTQSLFRGDRYQFVVEMNNKGEV